MKRDDRALPTVTGVATLPIVLRNGDLLSGEGLDRKRHRVSRAKRAVGAGTKRVRRYRRRQGDEVPIHQWLVDVATDYAGKLVLVSCALTIIERLAIAGAAGVLCCRGAARRRQDDDTSYDFYRRRRDESGRRSLVAERRRTAQSAVRLSRCGAGAPPVGQHSAWRGDRVPLYRAGADGGYLCRSGPGRARNSRVPAYTVQAFTGNNITPRGDLSSRSLTARITVDRPDPENREFKNADPIAWTERNRLDILRRSTRSCWATRASGT